MKLKRMVRLPPNIAEKMCRRGLLKFETDICIAVTGYIEPKKGCILLC